MEKPSEGRQLKRWKRIAGIWAAIYVGSFLVLRLLDSTGLPLSGLAQLLLSIVYLPLIGLEVAILRWPSLGIVVLAVVAATVVYVVVRRVNRRDDPRVVTPPGQTPPTPPDSN